MTSEPPILDSLSIDNVIIGLQQGELKILLIKHTEGASRGQWSLPGGFIRENEDLREAAARHLHDLTGLNDLYLEQFKTFGKVSRYPHKRVVTIAYYALVSADNYPLVANQNAEDIRWFGVREVPPLVFDHHNILTTGINHLRQQVSRKPVGFNLLPEKFTLLQLQELYEAILDTRLDKPNFRRKIMRMDILKACNEKQSGVAHRAANLYRFDPSAYQRLTEQGMAFEV